MTLLIADPIPNATAAADGVDPERGSDPDPLPDPEIKLPDVEEDDAPPRARRSSCSRSLMLFSIVTSFGSVVKKGCEVTCESFGRSRGFLNIKKKIRTN